MDFLLKGTCEIVRLEVGVEEQVQKAIYLPETASQHAGADLPFRKGGTGANALVCKHGSSEFSSAGDHRLAAMPKTNEWRLARDSAASDTDHAQFRRDSRHRNTSRIRSLPLLAFRAHVVSRRREFCLARALPPWGTAMQRVRNADTASP